MIKKIFYNILTLFFITVVIFSQVEENYENVENILKSRINNIVIYDIFDCNTAFYKGDSSWYGEKYNDPQRQLNDCYLFLAVEDTLINPSTIDSYKKYFFGVIKNNSLLWLSNSFDNIYDKGEFICIKDLNNNTKIDICFSWINFHMDTGQDSELYIYEWNGNTANEINCADNGVSNIVSYDYPYYKFIDYNGDNIYEIQASIEDSVAYYKWNGITFCKTENIFNYTQEGYTVANDFNEKINAIVFENNGFLKFRYLISNEFSSKQSISRLYLAIDIDSLGIKLPINWQFATLNSTVLCELATKNKYDLILPGKQLNGIILGGKKVLPSIKQYFTQANYEKDIAGIDYNNPNEILSDFINNIYHNSKSGFTIAPVAYPGSDKLGLVDSLDYFINKSIELGWIKNQATGDKYINLINSAKSYLNSGDNHSARSVLSDMKTESVSDSTSNLTSEAFALIYYNTDYLLTQIPDEPTIENLFKNPDFEDGSTNYWLTNNPYGGASCTLKVNASDPLNGMYDAQMSITLAGTATDRPLLVAYLKENKEIGSAYTLTFRTKVVSGSPAIKYINYGEGLRLFNGTLSGEQEWTFTTLSATNSTDDIAFYLDGTRLSSFECDNFVYKKIAADNPPVITEQPASLTATEGETATFSITASGSEPLNYQWQKNGTDIPGADSDEYTTPTVAYSDSGNIYRCVVTNQYGSATSNEAVLSVRQAGTGSGNLVTNSDFEDGTTNGYEISNTLGEAVYTFNVNSTSPVEGNYDAVMDVTQAGTNNSRPLIIIYLDENKETGADYTFSFKTKVISGNPAIYYLNYGTGLKLFNNTLSGEQEWSFTASAVTSSSNYIAIYVDGTQEGSFAIDEVVYERIE